VQAQETQPGPEALFPIEENGRWGYIDRTGKVLIEPRFNSAAEKNQTQVGRYNLKDFTSKSVLTLPHISFDSMAMWVDAKQKKIYVVYNNQLLRLPLP